jgi:hypothetical protein
MPLAPATRLGPYEILSPLGAGGMGEVLPRLAKLHFVGQHIGLPIQAR